MKILHIAETALGGVGSHMAELLREQHAALGHSNVRALVPQEHAFHLGAQRDGSVATFARPSRSPATLIRMAAAADDQIATFRPDVVHLHSTFAGLTVRALHGFRRGRTRIVYCPHGWGFDVRAARWRRAAVAAMETTLSLVSDRVIAVSRHEADRARRIGVGSHRIETVMNGIGAATAPGPAARWQDDRLKILFVGRLDRQKGLDVLLDAVAPLHRKLCLRIVGEGVADANARPIGGDGVEYLGWCSPAETRAQLDACDVVVLPSRWEAFGLVALEAMRAGKPVIASAVGGLREVIEHGRTGWLVPPDSPVALGRRLLEARKADLRMMGEAGRERFARLFTAERMNRQILEVYQRALAPAVGLVPAFG